LLVSSYQAGGVALVAWPVALSLLYA